MRVGTTISMTYIIIGLVGIMVALTVITGATTNIGEFFGTSETQVSAEECNYQVEQVRQGERAPDTLPTNCRTRLTQDEREQLQQEYEESQVSSFLTGG